MKVIDIISEMSWPDKFNALEQMIRDKDMTLEQLGEYLEKEYNLILVIQTNPTVPSFHVGGGGISPERFDEQQIKGLKNVPQELKDKVLDKFLFQVDVGPGPQPNTPVAEVTGFIHILKHELSHLQLSKQAPQDKLRRLQKDYISPHDNPNPVNVAMYMLQPIERPAQATDYANHLVRIGMTVDKFEESINAIFNYLKTQEGISAGDLTELAKSEMDYYFGSSRKMSKRMADEGLTIDVHQLTSTIGALALVKMAGTVASVDMGNKIKAQYKAFMKLLRKRYPKVKGYQLKHKEHRQTAYDKNAEERKGMDQMIDGMLNAMNTLNRNRA